MLPFDDSYGALWLGVTEQVMVDPFWQAPYKPDGDGATITWTEDDGSGNTDTASDFYYPHRPWVEATSVPKAGQALPDGMSLFYATTEVIYPPRYVVGSGGIPPAVGTSGGPIDSDGSYASIERPWGFKLRACTLTNRFRDYYLTFTDC